MRCGVRSILILAWCCLAAPALELPPGDLALPDDAVRDADGRPWVFAPDGSLAGEDVDAGGAFESAATLSIDNQGYSGGAIHVLRLADDPDPWYEFAVEQLGSGIEVARFAQLAPRTGCCRWLEVVRNGGAARRAVTLRLATSFLQPPRGVERAIDRGRDIGAAMHFGARGRVAAAWWWGDCKPALRAGATAASVERVLELAPGEVAGVVTALVVRPTADEAASTLAALDDERLCRGLPWLPDLVVVNARAGGDGIDRLRSPGVDTVTLVGGERLRGALLGDGLALAGGERVPLAALAGAVRRGAGWFLVRREDGETRFAPLAAGDLALALPSGAQATVPLSRVAAIAMRQDRPHASAGGDWEWQGVDEERRFLRGLSAPLRLLSVLGEIALPADQIDEVVGYDDGPVLVRLRDGSRLRGVPLEPALVALDAGGDRRLAWNALRRLRRVHPLEAVEGDALVATLVNGDRLRARLAAPIALAGRAGAQTIDAASLRALSIGGGRSRAVAHFIDGSQVEGALTEPVRLRTTWGFACAVDRGRLSALAIDLPAQARRALLSETRARLAALGGDDDAAREAGRWLSDHVAAMRDELERAYVDEGLAAPARRRLGLILGREF